MGNERAANRRRACSRAKVVGGPSGGEGLVGERRAKPGVWQEYTQSDTTGWIGEMWRSGAVLVDAEGTCNLRRAGE